MVVKLEGDLVFNKSSGAINPSWKVLQYFFIVIFMVITAFVLVNSRKMQLFFLKEFTWLSTLVLSFFTESLVYIFINQELTFTSFKLLIIFYIPIVASFLFLNSFSIQQIDQIMKCFFVIFILLYLFEKRDVLTINSFFQISFFDSKSPFESSSFSGYFYGFMIYFCRVERDKVFTPLSVVFNILVFKRINIIFSVLFLILGGISKEKKVSKNYRYFFSSIFTAIPIATYYFMIPGNLEKIVLKLGFFSTKGLLMGRNIFFNAIYYGNFRSSGYGSVGKVLSKFGFHGLEMDGLRLFIELGLLGVLLFSVIFWKVGNDSKKNNWILLLFFLNYCTSAQLSDLYAIFFNIICIGINNIRLERVSEKNDFCNYECI